MLHKNTGNKNPASSDKYVLFRAGAGLESAGQDAGENTVAKNSEAKNIRTWAGELTTANDHAVFGVNDVTFGFAVHRADRGDTAISARRFDARVSGGH